MPDLATAMKYNPNLKVQLNAGYFDLATPFFEGVYEMQHLPIPGKLQANIEYKFYDSGHMVYAHEAALKACTTTSPPSFARPTDGPIAQSFVAAKQSRISGLGLRQAVPPFRIVPVDLRPGRHHEHPIVGAKILGRLRQMARYRPAQMLQTADLIHDPAIEKRRPAVAHGHRHIVHGPGDGQLDERIDIHPGQRRAADQVLLLHDLPAGFLVNGVAAAPEFGQQTRFSAAGTAGQNDQPCRMGADQIGPIVILRHFGHCCLHWYKAADAGISIAIASTTQ
jgi:hypothetical protein